MKRTGIISILLIFHLVAIAQNAMDAYRISSTQIRGTARYVSMGGAFTSLGGDPSSIVQNPAGIGVYRTSEVSATIGGLWTKNSSPNAETTKNGAFTFDNMSLVTTFFTGKSSGLINFNLGVSYNRNQSYKRKYNSAVSNLGASFTNYLATVTQGIQEKDLWVNENKDSYYETTSPWLSILGYQSYLFGPADTNKGGEEDRYVGLFTNTSSGSSYTTVIEDGRNDEYSINFGGNVNDRIYFGVSLGIRDFSVSREVYYVEDLHNTYGLYEDSEGARYNINASNYQYSSLYHMKGTGFNGKFGVIIRATDNLRFGAAIHTPTFYSIDQTMDASVDNIMLLNNQIEHNEFQQIPAVVSNTIKIRTPWSFQLGASYVIGKKAIISADYQYEGYNTMSMKEYNNDEFSVENDFYKTYFKAANTIKIGAEYRITNALSLRAGYILKMSPIKSELKDVSVAMPTVGLQTTYTLPGNASYYSCGAGYKFKRCYLDFAYQHYLQKSDLFAYSPVFAGETSLIPASSEITTKQNSITFTFGLKF